MKAPRSVDPPNDPNGGQYVPTNPQYDAGYADGFKAGKEWMKAYLNQKFGENFVDSLDGPVGSGG